MIFRPDQDDDNEHQFEQNSIMDFLLSPYYFLVHFFGHHLGADDSIQIKQTWVQRLLGLLALPFRLIIGFAGFVVSTWSTSRNGLAFLRSIPVLAVLGTFGVSLLMADLFNTERKRLALTRGYIVHHAANTPQYCEMFARKLVELKPDPENVYQLGLAHDRMNERAQAFDVMRSIAPEDGGGFALAHVWVSQYYARSQSLDLTDAERDVQVKKHLNYAVELDPKNQMAQYTMAMHHIEDAKAFSKDSPEYRDLIEKAIFCLDNVVNSKARGLTRFELVAIPKMLELQLEINSESEDFKIKLAQEIIRLEPLADRYPDEIDIRITMVRCAVLMEDYNLALNIVREGYQLSRDPDVRQRIIGLASLVYLDRAAKFNDMTKEEQFRGRLHILCEAVRSNPSEKSIYLELLKFVGTEPSEPGIINDEWLRGAINGSPTPAVIHGLLGLKEIANGNVLIGEKHWRIAEQQYPSTRMIINNLMDVAATDRPEQFTKLSDMISLAIEMFPDEPFFYRTRGIHLAATQRYAEAILDLEYAAEKLPQSLDIHQHLIGCYEKTGDEAHMFEQKDILERKLGELDESQRKKMEQLISKIKF